MLKLTFGIGNAKLSKDTAIFSLPAGHSCPFASLCLSKADKLTGKLTDGAKNLYRCYAASAENLFSNIRVSRWRNFEALRGAGDIQAMTKLIQRSLPNKGIKLCRIHSSGDFFSQAYFDAWLAVAKSKPDLIFYAYTKALPFWVKRLTEIPDNFRLVASLGGTKDDMIERHNLRHVRVVFTEQEAALANLPIDHDDKLAWSSHQNFAILLHGTQPAGTPASKALHQLRKQKKGGYKANYFGHYKD